METTKSHHGMNCYWLPVVCPDGVAVNFRPMWLGKESHNRYGNHVSRLKLRFEMRFIFLKSSSLFMRLGSAVAAQTKTIVATESNIAVRLPAYDEKYGHPIV